MARLTWPRAGRNHDLEQDGLASAEQAWEEYWAATRAVELTMTVERRAGELAAALSVAPERVDGEDAGGPLPAQRS